MTDEPPGDRDSAYLATYDFESYARPAVAVLSAKLSSRRPECLPKVSSSR